MTCVVELVVGVAVALVVLFLVGAGAGVLFVLLEEWSARRARRARLKEARRLARSLRQQEREGWLEDEFHDRIAHDVWDEVAADHRLEGDR